MTNAHKGISKDDFYKMVGSFKAGKEKANKESFKKYGYEIFPTLNSYITSIYERIEGTSEFYTFKQWKDKGFKVKKGEKCYRIFSAPKSYKIGESKETGEDIKGNRFFQACIFSSNQVEPIENKQAA